MSSRKRGALLLAAVLAAVPTLPSVARATLYAYVDQGTFPTTQEYNDAVTYMTDDINRLNNYGDFGNYTAYTYYNSGIATEESAYHNGIGQTYPNDRVFQHELNHFLGSGTTSNFFNEFNSSGVWNGANMNALAATFDGDGTVIRNAGVHFYPYGLNYDSEVYNIDSAIGAETVLERNAAIIYAELQDDGLGNTAAPWATADANLSNKIALTQSDAVGTSAFNNWAVWNDGYFTHAGAAYSTGNYILRTALDTYNAGGASTSFTFAGDSLTVNNTNGASGGLQYQGVGTSAVMTFHNLILDGGYIGATNGSANLFQIAGTMTLNSTGTIDAAQGNINIFSTIGGSGSFTKAGTYALTLTGPNTFTGNINVSNGTLVAALSSNTQNPTSSALGNPQVAHSVTVNSGATLKFALPYTFGGATTTVATILVINAGGTVTNAGSDFTALGPVQLNGGTLTGMGGTATGYQMYDLRGTVTVGGTSVSTISGSGGYSGYHLAAPTVFNVADVATGTDLNVSGSLINQDAGHASAAGGLTKTGPGTMVLSGNNTYTGTTTVSAGQLAFTSGASSVGPVVVADGASLNVTPTASGTTALTSTSLTIGSTSGSSLLFDYLGNNTASPLISTGPFTANGPVGLSVQNAGALLSGSYPLVSYTSFTGTGTFPTGSITLGPRSIASLVNGTSALLLNVVADRPVWTGADNGNWQTGSTGTSHDWKLQVASTGTDYLAGDNVLFDDTATGSTAISLSVANVVPAAITFNNSSKSYTVSSTSGYGIGGTGGITKYGTGIVTLSTINSFTGSVTINAGTLFAAAPNALNGGALAGTSGVTVNSGGTLLTSENGLFGYNLANEQPITLNTGGALNSSSNSITTHLGQLTLIGGTLAYPGTPSGDGANFGSYNLDKGLVAGGTTTTSVISALGVNPLQIGGTLFNVAPGAANGVDLSVTGTLVHTSLGDTGIVKAGLGTMVLSGINTYTGGTAIDSGTLSISSDANLGGSAGGVTLNGGTLRTTNTSPLVFSRVFTIGAGSSTLAIVGNGAATTGQGDRLVTYTSNTLTGFGNLTITGGGTLAGTAPNTTTAGAGALVLSAGNAYSGMLTLQSGGMVEYSSYGALGTATVVVGNEGELSSSTGNAVTNAVIVSGGTDSVLSFTNSTGTFSGPITLNAAATVGLRDWYNYANVRSGNISGAISGTGNLTVNSGTGSGGVLTLNGASTFTGNVTINSSVVNAATNDNYPAPTTGALGNSSTSGRTVTVNNGATLVFTVGNVLGSGAQTTAPALSLVVNARGLLETAAQDVGGPGGGDANIFGNITLNGGTFTTGNGYSAAYQSVILLGTVTVAGTSSSTINTNASNTAGDGVMLGTSGGTTFNVGRTGSTGIDLTVSAPLVDANGGASGSLIKSGLGTMQLSAANTYTGSTTVNAGALNVVSGGAITASSNIIVGNTSGSGAAIYQLGGTVTNTNTGGGGMQIGSTAGAAGYYNLSSGTLNVAGEIDPGGSGGGAGTFGQFDMIGGTVNLPNTTGSYFLPDRGAAGEISVTNILGGTVQITGGGTPSSSGYNGLAANWSGSGAAQNATITVENGGQFLTPSLTTKLNLGDNSANITTLNLDSIGTLQTLGFQNAANGNSNVTINFNGGTLKAGIAGNTSFLQNLGKVYVYGSGGTIDNNGQSITIAQTISSPTGLGISAANASGGSGYVVPPLVAFIGGGGTGATGYATINSSTGAVSGIVITNPGTGYTGAPTLTLTAEGGGVGAILGTVTTATNASGTLTFQGSGITTLTAASTYTGATNVSTATLTVAPTGALPTVTALLISNSGTVNLNNAAQKIASLNGSTGSLNLAINNLLTISPNIGAPAAGQIGTLNLSGNMGAWTSKVDLTNNALVIHKSSLLTISTQIQQRYSGGTWQGSGGIISSTAAANSTHLTTLGVIVNDNGSGAPLYSTTFENAPTLDGDILVKYTYYGDANLDGKVDGSDYIRIDSGCLNHLTGWYNGDFNYDGVIDGSDYTLIDNAFNTQGAQINTEVATATAQIAGAASSAVPEPATLSLFGIGAVSLLGRRRPRRSHR